MELARQLMGIPADHMSAQSDRSADQFQFLVVGDTFVLDNQRMGISLVELGHDPHGLDEQVPQRIILLCTNEVVPYPLPRVLVVVWKPHEVAPRRDERPMQFRDIGSLFLSNGEEHVMDSDGVVSKIQTQQRQVIKPNCKLPSVELVALPELTQCTQRDRDIFRKHRQLCPTRSVTVGKDFEGHAHRR